MTHTQSLYIDDLSSTKAGQLPSFYAARIHLLLIILSYYLLISMLQPSCSGPICAVLSGLHLSGPGESLLLYPKAVSVCPLFTLSYCMKYLSSRSQTQEILKSLLCPSSPAIDCWHLYSEATACRFPEALCRPSPANSLGGT